MNDVKNYFMNTNAFIENNTYLRYPQRRAYIKLKESLEQNIDTHKIIVLPTGTGKTGTMGMLPYGISEGRVLIITPSLVIREGVSDDFDTRTPSNFWTTRNVILDDNYLPNVYRYAGYNSKSRTDKARVLRMLEKSNFIIANIHKVFNNNSNKTLIDLVDSDFFDMIMIDEAHHSAADSWLKTLEYFSAKKIVKLTATPYRTDEQELEGDIIYTYELSEAIKEGLVKNIVAEDYTNEKLEFLLDGELVDKETALQVMDGKWVSRSVAYSEKCNKTIVDMSLKRLYEKRNHGSTHHQILAVACDVEHAKSIKRLYEDAGLTAEVVSSYDPDHATNVIIEYKKGQIDVVVNVNMLGEGFDHSNISIAAIFRPFRSLPPYAQFIGRALRKIPGANDAIDNIAHIIYHKELDLDDLWDYYTGQKRRAETKKIIEMEYYRENYEQAKEIGEVVADGKVFSNFKEFLSDGVGDKYHNEIKLEIEAKETQINNVLNIMRSQGHSEEEIEQYRADQKKKLEGAITSKKNKLREELIREELHRLHTDSVIEGINQLFLEKNVDPKGNELPIRTSSPFLKSSGTNDGYAIKYINSCLKNKLKRGIDEWETYDFKEAEKLVPELLIVLTKKIDLIRKEG